ncbi:GNAT family N-acetyltransferase [Microvirga pakistanensis]|uniref:GNAT family N-acetyltransferase n=1 Tax=Microvirga pakistanensis TaxID=1682650 RepID=UPI00141B5A6F|nr:GNAT family N-acetyltransferase [Microvirga pakistanensis]
MVLEGLPAESGQREAFTAAAAKEGFGALPSGRTRIMHRADLSGGMEAYLSKRTATFRKSRRRHMNQCHRAGEVELVTYRGENIRRGLSILFELERHTWKADPTRNDARMRVPLDDRIRLFLTEVGTAFASSDDAVVIVMNFNGIPVGAMMGVSRRSMMLALLTYLRDDMRDTLNTYPLMDAFIQDAIAHGMTSLDMNGVTEYTRRWATHEDRYQRLYIFSRHPKARILQVSKALATNLSQLSRSVEWDRNGDDDGSH